MLVIDGIFLLYFLEQEPKWEDQRMAGDIMMLENQIPMLMLEDIREALRKDSFEVSDLTDLTLLDQFKKFCEKYSPLKFCQDSEDVEAAFGDVKHMLHFLYALIVGNYPTQIQSPTEDPAAAGCGLNLSQEIGKVVQLVCDGIGGAVSAIKQAQTQGLELPGPINKASELLEKLEKTSYVYNKNRGKNLQPGLLADKIDVPSVSQLHHIAKIKFYCTDGGITHIKFDSNENTLYLPEITLGQTSEVVLRNLIAYEAASGSDPELAEYVDFMCGIIKAENDVKLLRQFGTIKGDLLDDQIVGIFNGINKTTHIPPEHTEMQRFVQTLSEILQVKFNPLRKKKRSNEKIKVPSATELMGADLEFGCAGSGGGGKIYISINKENGKRILNLPEIKLDKNPKKALKDLAADEPGYFDFMCTIIQTEADVEILFRVETGIIKGDQNLTEKNILEAFGEIRKPIEWPNELSPIQKAVQELNKTFWNVPTVKAYKFMGNSFAAFQSWIFRILPILALMLLALQSFCEIYGCRARPSGFAGGSSNFRLDDQPNKLMMPLPRKVLGYDPY